MAPRLVADSAKYAAFVERIPRLAQTDFADPCRIACDRTNNTAGPGVTLSTASVMTKKSQVSNFKGNSALGGQFLFQFLEPVQTMIMTFLVQCQSFGVNSRESMCSRCQYPRAAWARKPFSSDPHDSPPYSERKMCPSGSAFSLWWFSLATSRPMLN